MSSNRGNRLALGWSAVMVAASLLTGCATAETGLQRDAARQLQARVLEVTQASSLGDPGGALKALDGLEAELEAAQARGDISEERRRSITTIATAVRADLEDAVAAAERAATEKAAAENAAADKAAAEQAAEEAAPQAPPPAVQEPAPAPAPAPEPQEADKDDDKRADKGKGND